MSVRSSVPCLLLEVMGTVSPLTPHITIKLLYSVSHGHSIRHYTKGHTIISHGQIRNNQATNVRPIFAHRKCLLPFLALSSAPCPPPCSGIHQTVFSTIVTYIGWNDIIETTKCHFTYIEKKRTQVGLSQVKKMGLAPCQNGEK